MSNVDLMSTVKMSKGHRLRALVNERLSAAAEEIFALFERTIAEYEEELCRSKEETQSKQELLHSVLRPTESPAPDHGLDRGLDHGLDRGLDRGLDHGLDRGLDHGLDRGLIQDTQTSRIKEEPEEHCAQQLPAVIEFTAVCVKTEEAPLLQQIQIEQGEDAQGEDIADADGVWRDSFSCSASQMETEADGDHHNQVQISAGATAAQNCLTDVDLGNRPESSVTVNKGEVLGTNERAERKKYQCPMCLKRFGSVQNLQRHIRIHTGEKPYSCSICMRTFNQKGNLDRHVMIHTGERPFSCSTCEKAFSEKGNLDQHMRIHTGERPYSCLTCEKTFSHKSTLDKHIRTHTGEKPYSCSLCNKWFSVSARLKAHMSSHHTGSD